MLKELEVERLSSGRFEVVQRAEFGLVFKTGNYRASEASRKDF